MIQLNNHESRVLGVLVEKALTTPAQYPLTLNGLRSACNQSTNRDPVMSIDDTEAEAATAKKHYEDQLGDARAEAARIREHAKEQGAQIIAELREQANTEAARITETAHKQIAAERQQAMIALRGEVGRLSTDLASKIVGESLHEETRQRGIVDRFLADLDSGAITPEQVGSSGQGR